MDLETIRRALMRIAHEILEKNKGASNKLVIIGIRTGGAHLAERIQDQIESIENQKIPIGSLDITLYRDDLTEIGPQPNIGATEIDFPVDGKRIILVDDVLFTGRTIRSALDAIIDFGRPELIQLAVLVDRGHRELPIKADYVGKNIPTSKSEKVIVQFREHDGEDAVLVAGKGLV